MILMIIKLFKDSKNMENTFIWNHELECEIEVGYVLFPYLLISFCEHAQALPIRICLAKKSMQIHQNWVNHGHPLVI